MTEWKNVVSSYNDLNFRFAERTESDYIVWGSFQLRLWLHEIGIKHLHMSQRITILITYENNTLPKTLLTCIDYNFLSGLRRYLRCCITKRNGGECGEEGRECVWRICLFRECVLPFTRHAYKISSEVNWRRWNENLITYVRTIYTPYAYNNYPQ